MAKAVKRRSVWSGSKKAQAQKPARPPARLWSQVLGEAVILALVVAVPIVINPKSQVLTDVKDAVLGLGAALGIALWLVAGLAQRRLSWVRTPLLPLCLAYLSWALISTLYTGYPSAAIGEVGRLAAGVALFLLTVFSIRSLPQVRRIIGAVCVVSVPVSIYALAQHAGHDFITWSSAAETGRVFSFLGNATYLGGFAVLVIPALVAATWSRLRGRGATREVAWRLSLGALLACTVMLLAALYFSFTIAAVIGLVLGGALVLLLVVVRGGRKAARTAALGLVIAVIVLGIAGSVIYPRMPTVQRRRLQKLARFQDPVAGERALHWRTALGLFREKPVTGWGYGTFKVYALERMTAEWYAKRQGQSTQMLVTGYAHNEYLQVLADTGAIGGLLFFALLAAFALTLARVALRHPEAEWRHISLGLTAAVTAFLLQNAVGVTFRQAGASMFFWLWMGVAAAGAASLPRREDALSRAPIADWRGPKASLAAAAAAAVGAAAVLAVLAWVAITPVVGDMRLRLARALAGEGHFAAAIAVCDATLDLCPSSALAYHIKAYAAGKLGDHKTAAEANLASLKLSPGNATTYYNLGVTYKEMHQYAEAEKVFREAIRLMPVKQHYASLAETLFESGQLDKAEQEAHRAIEVDPWDREEPATARVNALLASIAAKRSGQLAVLLIRQQRYREGLPEARRWAQLEPNSGMAQRAVGVCAFSVGDFAAAREAFQRQVELEPANLKARLDLAYTDVKLKDYDNALAGFRYVAEHGGDSREGKEARRVLEKVQSQPRPAPAR